MKRLRSIAAVFAVAIVCGASLSAQTKIQFTNEGFLGGTGPIQDVIANYKRLAETGTDEVAKYENRFRFEYWTELKKVLDRSNISLEGVDWGWAETLSQKQIQSSLAKTGPDVWVGETQMPGFAAKGLLEPFPADLDKKIRDIAQPGAYSAMVVNNKIYGVTTTPGVSLLFWNKDLVRKAGLDPEKAPATWAELKANADAVTKAGKGEFFGGGVYVGPHFGGSLRYYAWLLENGGGFVDAKLNPTINSQANIDAIKYIKELNKNMPVGVAGDPDEGAFWNAVSQQKIAYFVDGPWRKAAMDSLKIDVGYSAMSLPKAGVKPVSVGIGMAVFGVPAYSKNKAGAFKLIEAMLDKRVQDVVEKYEQRPVVLKAYSADSAYMDSYMGAFYKTFLSSVQGLPTFAGNSNAKIWDLVHNAVTEAVVTNGDIKTILDAAQKKAAALK